MGQRKDVWVPGQEWRVASGVYSQQGGLLRSWAPWHGLGIYLRTRQERLLNAPAYCLAQVLAKVLLAGAWESRPGKTHLGCGRHFIYRSSAGPSGGRPAHPGTTNPVTCEVHVLSCDTWQVKGNTGPQGSLIVSRRYMIGNRAWHTFVTAHQDAQCPGPWHSAV